MRASGHHHHLQLGLVCLAMSVVLRRSVAWKEMEMLPELLESESVDRWFARTGESQVLTVNDSAWWRYQQEVMAWCKPLWQLVPSSRRLSDFDLLDLWHQAMPQLGRFVYVPLPWHHIVEQHGMLRKDYGPLRQAARIFDRLDFEDFDHFITLGQASFPQIRKYCKRGGLAFRHLDKLTLIFTSRLENLDRVARGEPPSSVEIPVPLLYRRELEARPASPALKRPRAFFSGSCTCPMRHLLAPLADSSEFDMSQVHPCGKKMPRQRYVQSIANSTWVLTPRGSFPAAYMMSETVQAGSLPVYIYGWKYNSSKTLPPVDALVTHLPFANMGLDWRRLGLVLTADTLHTLPGLLGETDPDSRLLNVIRLRPLFTIDGLFKYILAVLAHHAAKANATWPSSTNGGGVLVNRRLRPPLIKAAQPSPSSSH